jgi:hypothetical protein
VRTASAARHLRVVEGGVAEESAEVDADVENAAALAQPAQPEDDSDDDPVSTNEDSMSGAVSQSDNLADNPDPEASK